MGQWNMTVVGTGAHHNKDYDKDADKMFAEFVEKLKEAGHQVRHASFTHGARENVEQNDTI